MTIQTKLMALLLSGVLLPLSVVSVLSYQTAVNELEQQVFSELEVVVQLLEQQIETSLAKGNSLEVIASDLWQYFGSFRNTGEALLVLQDKQGNIQYLTPRRFEEQASDRTITTSDMYSAAVQALQQKDGRLRNSTDYRDIPVYAATRYLDKWRLGLVVKVDRIEVLEPLVGLRKTLRQIAVIVALVAIVLAWVFSHSLSKPLKQLQKLTKKVADGQADVDLSTLKRHDEIGDLSQSFNDMAHQIERSQAGIALKTQELHIALREVQKFEQAVSSSTEAIEIIDQHGTVHYVNDAWVNLMGYSHAETVGQTSAILRLDTEYADVQAAIVEALKEHLDFESEAFELERKSGQGFAAELRLYPIAEASGDASLYVVVINNITLRKRLDTAKSEFVSLASHQLRTPLTGIRWGTEMILRDMSENLTVMQTEILTDINRSAAHMADTIGTMLRLARLESGRVNLDLTAVKLREVVEAVVGDLELEHRQRKQLVELQIDEGITLQTDRELLSEVIKNLVSNATTYSPSGAKIEIEAVLQPNDHVRLSVADNGYGIPQHQQDRIFTKFFRGDNVLRKETDGSGLGLYLVYRVIELLHGTVSFASQEAIGTTFSIVLPLTLGADD